MQLIQPGILQIGNLTISHWERWKVGEMNLRLVLATCWALAQPAPRCTLYVARSLIRPQLHKGSWWVGWNCLKNPLLVAEFSIINWCCELPPYTLVVVYDSIQLQIKFVDLTWPKSLCLWWEWWLRNVLLHADCDEMVLQQNDHILLCQYIMYWFVSCWRWTVQYHHKADLSEKKLTFIHDRFETAQSKWPYADSRTRMSISGCSAARLGQSCWSTTQWSEEVGFMQAVAEKEKIPWLGSKIDCLSNSGTSSSSFTSLFHYCTRIGLQFSTSFLLSCHLHSGWSRFIDFHMLPSKLNRTDDERRVGLLQLLPFLYFPGPLLLCI